MFRRAATGRLSSITLSLLLALLIVALGNFRFWATAIDGLAPLAPRQLAFLVVLGVMTVAVLWNVIALLLWPPTARAAGITLVAISGAAAYFMDRYGVVLDRIALQSVLETDSSELAEWISPWMLVHAALVLPALWLVVRRRPVWLGWRRELGQRLALMAATAIVLTAGLGGFYAEAASLARNHRELHHLLNPLNVLTSGASLIEHRLRDPLGPAQVVGGDARVRSAHRKPRRLVLVVGESARAESFGLLGYGRDTTPELAQRGVIAFGNVASCGTATAVSLPCMFGDRGHDGYRDGDAKRRENLVDVVRHAGIWVRWIDNNTGSKGLAARAGELGIDPAAHPDRCPRPDQCLDEALLDEFDTELAPFGAAPSHDELIILHQRGSHGPSYFERYPPQFRRFVPTCDSNQLEHCSREQLVNTYDNTILYTDHVLARLIDRLLADPSHAAALLYVSDHGESTGENGLFLHGMPYRLAPPQQTRVPLLLWLADLYRDDGGIDPDCLRDRRMQPYSHDHLFHTVLGLLDIDTEAYRAELDITTGCGRPRQAERTAEAAAALS